MMLLLWLEGHWFYPKLRDCRLLQCPEPRVNGHLWWLWVVTDDSKCAWERFFFYYLLVFQFRTEWTEALQISVSPASGQMGHIRPVCAGEWTKTSQRHLELPHLSLTDPGGEPVHIWDSPGCLTFPPMSPQRGVCPDALEGTYFWGHGTGETAEKETSR